jgi:hypothetical protein
MFRAEEMLTSSLLREVQHRRRRVDEHEKRSSDQLLLERRQAANNSIVIVRLLYPCVLSYTTLRISASSPAKERSALFRFARARARCGWSGASWV